MITRIVDLGSVHVGSSRSSLSQLRKLANAIMDTRNAPPSTSVVRGEIRNATVVLLPPAPGDSLEITSIRLGKKAEGAERATLEMPPQVNQLAARVLELMEAGAHPELTGRLTETLMSRL